MLCYFIFFIFLIKLLFEVEAAGKFFNIHVNMHESHVSHVN